SVLDTEITPELVPSGEEEELQSSEAQVGPFALQDFSLFHVLRFGFRPSKIAFLGWHAWSDPEQGNWPAGFPEDKRPSYSLKEIRHWLQVFVQRFYSFSQFKRSALPNGPKVSHGGALSPRGDWRAPSDMSARIWIDEIEREVPEDYPDATWPRRASASVRPRGRIDPRWRCRRDRRRRVSATGTAPRRDGPGARSWRRAG